MVVAPSVTSISTWFFEMLNLSKAFSTTFVIALHVLAFNRLLISKNGCDGLRGSSMEYTPVMYCALVTSS
ncbi:hypothetical protein Trydic_g13342 [Trypoxylus dichotomus]